MQELITRLTEKAGISTDQANIALETMKDFVKEKFPMMAGAVDNLFGSAAETTSTSGATGVIPDPAAPKAAEDKFRDTLPENADHNVEDFAKNATIKAAEVFDEVKEKLSGLFGDDKK